MDNTLLIPQTPATPSTDPINTSPSKSDDVGFTIEKQLEEKLETEPSSMTPTLDPVALSAEVNVSQIPLPTVSEPSVSATSETVPSVTSLPDLENLIAPTSPPLVEKLPKTLPSPAVALGEGGSPSASPQVPFAEDPTIQPPSRAGISSEGKEKSGSGSGKKLVAGIAALAVLVAALGAGLYFLGLPGAGELRGQAATCTSDSVPTGNCDDCGWENQGQCGVGDSDTCSCNPGNAPCDAGFEPNGAGGCRVPVPPTPPGGGLGGSCPPDLVVWCATFDCPSGDTDRDGTCNPTPHDGYSGDQGATYTVQSGSNCPQPSSGCGQIDKYNAGVPGVDWNAYCGHSFISFTNCRTSMPTTPPEATPTGTSSLQCVDVRAQMQEDGAWIDVPNNNLSAIGQPGGTVRFVARVSTNLASGYTVNFAIIFNGTPQNQVGTLLPDPNPSDFIKEYAVTYTIPAAGTLSVTATIAVP